MIYIHYSKKKTKSRKSIGIKTKSKLRNYKDYIKKPMKKYKIDKIQNKGSNNWVLQTIIKTWKLLKRKNLIKVDWKWKLNLNQNLTRNSSFKLQNIRNILIYQDKS